MSLYLSKITRLRDELYSNKGQLETVIGVRNYINEHYDKELNLDLLSSVRFTSKYHLIRLFARYYRQTPGQYLYDKRMEKAMILLRKGYRVKETCYETGFNSPSSFSTFFRSRTGISPSQFQKRATFIKSV